MAECYDRIDAERRALIEAQHVFFVATAPDDLENGFPNLSPKGRNLLRVLGPNLVAYLDYPGSGNETAAHLGQNGRITLMFCSFEKAPGVVRLYGRGRRLEVDDPEVLAQREAFGADIHRFVRQAFFIDIERVQTSCGYAVPRLEFVADRETLDRWCEARVVPREEKDGVLAGGELVVKPKPAVG